jgi:anti-sigma regulatory factor (Ser/Thr protein kinase)
MSAPRRKPTGPDWNAFRAGKCNAAGGPPRISTIDLPYEETSPSIARHWAQDVLAAFIGAETIDAVVICISELVTNAQVHTRPTLDRKEITCRLEIIPGRVVNIWGEVIDAGSPGKTPRSQQVDGYDESGRGLSQVVTSYADGWGYERVSHHECKTWFKVHDRTVPLRDTRPEWIATPLDQIRRTLAAQRLRIERRTGRRLRHG